jgi:hypothetical protein
MAPPEVIQEAADHAGITTDQAERVVETVEESQRRNASARKAALKKAREALVAPPGADRVGLFALPFGHSR